MYAKRFVLLKWPDELNGTLSKDPCSYRMFFGLFPRSEMKIWNPLSRLVTMRKVSWGTVTWYSRYHATKRTGWHIRLRKTSRCFQNKSYVLAWPRQDRSGQSGTQVLKSTGGFEQVLLSPCTLQMFINLKAYFQGGISIGLRWRPRSPRPPGQSEWGQRGCSPASTRIPNWQSWAKFDKWTSVHAMSQQD